MQAGVKLIDRHQVAVREMAKKPSRQRKIAFGTDRFIPKTEPDEVAACILVLCIKPKGFRWPAALFGVGLAECLKMLPDRTNNGWWWVATAFDNQPLFGTRVWLNANVCDPSIRVTNEIRKTTQQISVLRCFPSRWVK
jgi:hypothetical protein